jgi:hypothetical protein
VSRGERDEVLGYCRQLQSAQEASSVKDGKKNEKKIPLGEGEPFYFVLLPLYVNTLLMLIL